MSEIVPSDGFPNGLAAIEDLLTSATSVSAAVAFVTESGVRRLADVLEGHEDVEVEVVARGAYVTTPEALGALRELGVNVSVVMGRYANAFHPKLWLFRTADELRVLSGSGNLTEGGLVDNDEQFEVLRFEAGSDEAAAHEDRFDLLTAHAVALADAEKSPIWAEWLRVLKLQKRLRSDLRHIEAQLSRREVIISRDADKAQLLEDLEDLYRRTVETELRQRDGRRYVPSRFKQGIERVRRGGDPVLLVTRICRRQTEGFNVILDADKPELTVETLVLDESKSYHDLFSETTRRLSAERLEQFPSWSS